MNTAEPSKVLEWRKLRFGMFIHFGLYSVPAGIWKGRKIEFGYSEQIFHHGHIPKSEYEALAAEFNPRLFDADAIARLAIDAGMRYIVITSKHHDGFNMFHTRHSKFNIVEATPYGRDIVGELSKACARNGLKFGVYFSWIDWHCPHALPMSLHNSDQIPPEHMRFNLAQVEELMSNYGPIAEVWFDMGAPTLGQSREMAALVRRLQPDAMINGRIWNDQGDFIALGDNEVPDFAIAGPWQTPASIYHSTWGYRSWQERTDLHAKIAELTSAMGRVFQLGGNYLLNIGPRGDGSVVEFEADVLRGIGRWLRPYKTPAIGFGDPKVLKCPGKLQCSEGVPYHHFAGKDYGSSRRYVVERRWLIRPESGGDYQFSVDFREGFPFGARLEIAAGGRTLSVKSPATPSTVAAGYLHLEGNADCEIVLRISRADDYAENPVELNAADLVVEHS